mgnify:FL=1
MQIRVPLGVRAFFDNKEVLRKPHCEKVNNLLFTLTSKSINKYRFEREDFEQTCLGAINKLVSGTLVLNDWIRKDFMNQFNTQLQNIISSFSTIKPAEDIADIKKYFLKNRRRLTKINNMPEDSDLGIMKALSLHDCKDKKVIISEDEHFWGYKDLLDKNYGFIVVEEWNCHLIGA